MIKWEKVGVYCFSLFSKFNFDMRKSQNKLEVIVVMFVFCVVLIFLWWLRFLLLLFLCFTRLLSLLEGLGAWNRCRWFPFAALYIWTSSKKFFVEIWIISGAYNESSSRYLCFRESILPDVVWHQFVMFETLFMGIVYYHWVFGTSFVLVLVKMK